MIDTHRWTGDGHLLTEHDGQVAPGETFRASAAEADREDVSPIDDPTDAWLEQHYRHRLDDVEAGLADPWLDQLYEIETSEQVRDAIDARRTDA